MLSIIDKAPAELSGDIALIDGVLFFSDARRGDPMLISFLSLARRLGVTDHCFVPAEDFRGKYSGADPSVLRGMSDIQSYAINLLAEAYRQNATDIHIAYYGSYGIIKFRSLGMLRDYAKLPGDRTRNLIASIYNTMSQSANTTTFVPKLRQDSRIVSRSVLPSEVHSVRIHSEPLECAQAEDGTGSFMALRLLHDRTEARGGLAERLTALGYGEKDIVKFRQLTERTGLTIISGPTGHGKSTLLKHVMDAQALKNPQKNYMSIEDPPEYPLFGVHQVMVSTNFDGNPAERAQEYTNAIAGAMRSDPDVLMIGEIRYPEAAKAAIDSALTGHGTFATLHANHAVGIIMRMEALLSEAGYANPLEYLCDHNVLAGLIYQRLVPVLCPFCKMPLTSLINAAGEDEKHREEVLPRHTMERLMRVIKGSGGLDTVHILGHGCEQCNHLGIVAQTVAAENIVTDETFLRHVRQGNSDKAYEYWLKDMKGRTYIQHAIEGIAEGRLDPYLTELRLGVPLDFIRNVGEKA